MSFGAEESVSARTRSHDSARYETDSEGVVDSVVGCHATTAASVLAVAVADAFDLTVVGAAFWMNVVLARDPEPNQAAAFGVFHLVYGVVLAAVLVYAPLG